MEYAVLGGFAVQSLAGAAVSRPRERLELKNYIHRVEMSYRNVRTLHAAFTQVYSADGDRRVESGAVELERGGRMRWHYQSPQQKLFIADGKNLILYVPAERQMTRSREKTSGDVRVPLSLLLSRVKLGKVFSSIEFANRDLPHPVGNRILRALPKGGSQSGYSQVLIELDPELNIRRLVISYAEGGTMDFRFTHIVRNAPLPRSAFIFNPPAGTEIIDEP